MPIDNSIYFQQRGPDIAGGVEKGMRMADMIQDRKLKQKALAEDQAIKDAFKKNVGPDGQLNQGALLSEITGINPEKSLAYKKDFAASSKASAESDAAQMKAKSDKLGMIANLAGSATDQASYDMVRAQAVKLGLANPDELPSQYDPNLIKRYQGMALTQKDRIDQMWKEKQFGADQSNKDREFGLRQAELGIKRQDVQNKGLAGENLPIDKKKTVETLSTKNAGKIAIKNQIDSVMSTWDNLPDDQKVAAGRQLLKTLNSTEGADAIGSEEAKRLGSKLEYAMGNLFNSNPVQFGRDLEGFKTQALNTSQSIGQAVKSNQSMIDETMGRQPQMAGADADSQARQKRIAELRAKMKPSKVAGK